MADSDTDRLIETPLPPKRGRRGTRGQQEVAKDVAQVEKMLREGAPTHAIVARMARGRSRISERTTMRYVAQVRARWKAEMLVRSETAREERIAQLQETREALWRDRKPLVVDGVVMRGARYDATIARYDEMINELLGVGGVVKVVHSGAVAVVPIPAEAWGEIGDEELDTIERVAARFPALEAHPVGDGEPKP